jgi:hypothetical protein
VAHVGGDRPRVAVQRELEAAAEACAVDRGDGREGELADPVEQRVADSSAERPSVVGFL